MKYTWPCRALPHICGSARNDHNLCLGEFSKSLTNHAYTLYLNLKPGSAHDWEHVVSLFNNKFFYAETKFTLAELGKTRPYPREDSDVYVKRFHEKAIDFCSNCWRCPSRCFPLWQERRLPSISREILLSFSPLMEAARRKWICWEDCKFQLHNQSVVEEENFDCTMRQAREQKSQTLKKVHMAWIKLDLFLFFNCFLTVGKRQ